MFGCVDKIDTPRLPLARRYISQLVVGRSHNRLRLHPQCPPSPAPVTSPFIVRNNSRRIVVTQTPPHISRDGVTVVDGECEPFALRIHVFDLSVYVSLPLVFGTILTFFRSDLCISPISCCAWYSHLTRCLVFGPRPYRVQLFSTRRR